MRREVRCSGCGREYATEGLYEKHSCGLLSCPSHPERAVTIFGKCRGAWCPCGKPLESRDAGTNPQVREVSKP